MTVLYPPRLCPARAPSGKLIRLSRRQANESETCGAEKSADGKDRRVAKSLRQTAHAESGEDRPELTGVRKQRRGGAGAMRHERVEETDPEIGDEGDADRPRNLRPEDPAHRTHERQRDKIDNEGGKASDNRHALSALERPPDQRSHDDDFQSGAQAHRDSDVAFNATQRRRKHDGKRDRAKEHRGVKQGERRESERERWTAIHGFWRTSVACLGENRPGADESERGECDCAW